MLDNIFTVNIIEILSLNSKIIFNCLFFNLSYKKNYL